MFRLKRVAAIGICCTIVTTGAVWAVLKDEPVDDKSRNQPVLLPVDDEKKDSEVEIRPVTEGIPIQVNGNWLQLDVEPFIENDRTLIPLRGIMEELGADVGWNGEERYVTVDKDDISIKLYIGSDIATVIREGGKEEKVELDVAAKIVNDRTFIPGRFVSETLGAEVDWDSAQRAMIVNTEIEGEIPEDRVSEVDFEIIDRTKINENEVLSKWYQNNYKKEGIYTLKDGDWKYALISAGEKMTGGYNVKIHRITEPSPTEAHVYAQVMEPDENSFVTMAITYPNVLIRFNKNDIVKVDGEIIDSESGIEPNDEVDKSLNEMGNAIPADLVKEMKLFSLMNEEIKTFTDEEAKEIIDVLNSGKTYTGAYIMMLAGNNIQVEFKNGSNIKLTSYGNENHVILSGEIDGEHMNYCIIAPEVGKILLDVKD
ncbi:stalk domain-containing protein [Herbivorax sp. ANBcel31]|uniref:stalk domain-containing protein n=1 Tax=Herbivorax sp. ANBcel31 TaxID=3069754 RepID=UPI0027B14768|nr:stalk domain-containing protein [Herbivorax sp. ANBcel31]MDQ2085219.1 stalk domain-containing protein [Herbivorax sp. ANBcel31]